MNIGVGFAPIRRYEPFACKQQTAGICRICSKLWAGVVGPMHAAFGSVTEAEVCALDGDGRSALDWAVTFLHLLGSVFCAHPAAIVLAQRNGAGVDTLPKLCSATNACTDCWMSSVLRRKLICYAVACIVCRNRCPITMTISLHECQPQEHEVVHSRSATRTAGHRIGGKFQEFRQRQDEPKHRITLPCIFLLHACAAVAVPQFLFLDCLKGLRQPAKQYAPFAETGPDHPCVHASSKRRVALKSVGIEEMVESLRQQNALLEQRELERVELEQRRALVKHHDVFVARTCAFFGGLTLCEQEEHSCKDTLARERELQQHHEGSH